MQGNIELLLGTLFILVHTYTQFNTRFVIKSSSMGLIGSKNLGLSYKRLIFFSIYQKRSVLCWVRFDVFLF